MQQSAEDPVPVRVVAARIGEWIGRLGEIWVDGVLPRKPGDVGGPIVAGFNAPNRVELKDAKPGKTYSIAVFGINGPISATPTNYTFLGPTYLELSDAK